MTVVDVRQLPDRRGQYSEQSNRSYSIRYLVRTSSKQDSVHTILTNPSIPQVGDSYTGVDQFDFGVRVTNVTARAADNNPKLWYVDVQYGNVQEDDPINPEPLEPEEKLPRISWRFDRMLLPVWGSQSTSDPGELAAEDPMCNSKGQPFSPPVQYEVTVPTLQIRAWDTFLRSDEIAAATDVINSTTYGGLPTKTLKLNISNIEEIFREGKRYWQKDYELAFNPRTWDKFVLDYGYFPDPATGDVRMFLIDNAGNLTTSTSDANYIQKQVYATANFSGIRFINRYVDLLAAI